ncbi:hypothetical protein EUX98_g9469 [Antrodiella citrinella]|uniref:Uncharacterized protein n=1 Tax=Antrodiella citrinella TaxID=2447956 RepID=A0A4S4LTQ0_9APHY|nr:hypothetical protein EUX98_g9469 [Antrodiella citrinella]
MLAVTPDRARIATTTYSRKSDRGRVDVVYPYNKDDPETQPEEIVFRLQAYVVHATLPPVSQKTQLTRKDLKARQFLRVTGLGATAFDEVIEGLQALRDNVASRLLPSNLSDTRFTDERGHPVLEFGNRYFSFQTEAGSDEDSVELENDIDPFGILRHIGEEGRGESVLKYELIKPGLIRVGHLVELQVGICAMPTGRNKYTFIPKLRSVCILSRDVENDCHRINFARVYRFVPMKRTKRKVGYMLEDDEEELTERALTKLRIDEDDTMGVTATEVPSVDDRTVQ